MISLALITSHAPSLVHFRGPLIRALTKQGVKVFALAPNYDQVTRDAVRKSGGIPIDFPVSRTGMNPLRDLYDMIELARLLRQLKPDITLGYFVKPVIFGTLAAWLARVPSRFAMIEGLGIAFTSINGAMSFKRTLLKRTIMLLYKIALTFAHRVVFLNKDDMSEFVGARLLPVCKAFRLGGIGVDLSDWSPAPSVTQPVTFILVARLLREKGVEDYANAARVVKRQYPQARFLLLGGLDENPGSIRAEEVEAWVNEGILEWPGHVHVQPWLTKSSVFVLPSYYREGVPRSTQEAMAMSRAVITTDAPGCRETVVDGVNGYLVPVHNDALLAQKMIAFIEKPELIHLMGRASRQLAEERFDVHKINQLLIKVLLENESKWSRNEATV